MADAVSVKIEGLEEFLDALKRYPKIAGKHLGDAIKRSIFALQKEAVERTPISEGRLRGSFATAFSMLRGELTPQVDYAIYVHEGTRPHWPPYGPGTPLERWAHLHNVEPFVVARAISRRGTKAHPFLREGLAAAEADIGRFFKNGLDDTLKQIAEESKP